MHILHARDFAVQPWKNGGGVTSEIAAYPAGAGFDTFGWRVSMATVATAGAFSTFSGIDRTLGLLEGSGITLAVAGRGEVALREGSPPIAFPGDVPVSAALAAGPILDLNVMTRRGSWRHLLSRVTVGPGRFTLARSGDVTLALLRGTVATAGTSVVGDGDAVMLDTGEMETPLDLAASGVLWVADLWRL